MVREKYTTGITTLGYMLASRVDTEVAAREGFTWTVPSRWLDLNRMATLEAQFVMLGIKYGKNDIYPAFKTEEELNNALLKVHQSDWSERWSIEPYLVEKGLIKKPKN